MTESQVMFEILAIVTWRGIHPKQLTSEFIAKCHMECSDWGILPRQNSLLRLEGKRKPEVK
jgi:hypothetical protein